MTAKPLPTGRKRRNHRDAQYGPRRTGRGPYHTVMVCTHAAYLRKKPNSPPHFLFFVSLGFTAAAAVPRIRRRASSAFL